MIKEQYMYLTKKKPTKLLNVTIPKGSMEDKKFIANWEKKEEESKSLDYNQDGVVSLLDVRRLMQDIINH